MKKPSNEEENRAEYLSEEGLEQLKEKLEKFKTIKRKEIAGRLEYAQSLGDLSENSEYQEAKEAQLENEFKIAELEDVLLRSIVVEKSTDHATVSLGSTVVVKRDGDTEEMRFILVGTKEVDLSSSKISHESPLGRVLLGRKRNDKVTAAAPKGEVKYKIIDIL